MTQPTTTYAAPPEKAGPHHKIMLVYDPYRELMIALDDGKLLRDNILHLNLNDTVEFWSPQGPVHVGFKDVGFTDSKGDKLRALTSQAGSATLTQAPTEGARIWCGIQLNGQAYGYPHQELDNYGIQPEIP